MSLIDILHCYKSKLWVVINPTEWSEFESLNGMVEIMILNQMLRDFDLKSFEVPQNYDFDFKINNLVVILISNHFF